METLDFDVELLNGIPVGDIKRIIITNRGGSVTIKSTEKSIRDFWLRHPNLAVEYRPEYGWTTKASGCYQSVCLEMR
jgi:hypothetical protein